MHVLQRKNNYTDYPCIHFLPLNADYYSDLIYHFITTNRLKSKCANLFYEQMVLIKEIPSASAALFSL